MRNLTWNGTLTATSSISHSGSTGGVVTLFRREALIQADGTLLPGVPIVSGSVIRGQLRRHAADLTLPVLTDIFGSQTIAFPIANLLRSGGALRGLRRNEEPVNAARQAALRSYIPLLGCFGGAVGSRIISGRLTVDKAIPLTQETAHLAPFYGLPEPDGVLPSIWQIMQRERHSMFTDHTNIGWDVEENTTDAPTAMRYVTETLPIGTRLMHAITLKTASPIEQAFLTDVLTTWAPTARVGGMSAKGMGRIHPHYDLSATTVDGAPASAENEDWRSHMRAHADELIDALGWV